MTQRDAAPKRAKFWFDPRFAIGLVLIVASVAGVFAILTASDSSELVLSARDPINPGDIITVSDLVATSVRIEGASQTYLIAEDVPDEGLVVTRPIAAGELVPASAVGSTAGLRQASVVISVSGRLAASIGPGATVDLWAARELESGLYGPPIVVVSSATVVRIVESDGLVVDDSAGTVEVLVPRLRIARVLEAIANEDALSLVPTSIPVKG
jgi:hypothetical protein